MHPEVGARRRLPVPCCFGSVKQVDVPGVLIQPEHWVIQLDQYPGRIPVVPGARIRYEAGRHRDIGLVRPQLGYPYDINSEARVCVLREQLLFEAPGPVEAGPSRRRDEHYDADLPSICIEGSAQRLGSRAQIRVWRHWTVRDAGTGGARNCA